jgi:hypothetical protein
MPFGYGDHRLADVRLSGALGWIVHGERCVHPSLDGVADQSQPGREEPLDLLSLCSQDKHLANEQLSPLRADTRRAVCARARASA